MTVAKTPTKAPILVLGIGNLLLRDEGVGVHVVRALESLRLPDDVELLDGGTAGADLLDAISERRKLIVVDALDADVPPGTMMRMEPADLAAGGPESLSLHEFGLAETLRMAAYLNGAPAKTAILAIRPRDTTCGLELSAEMTRWLPRLLDAVLDEIASGAAP